VVRRHEQRHSLSQAFDVRRPVVRWCVCVCGALALFALAGCATGPVERVGTGVKFARSAEPEDIDKALRRAAEFLVGFQNKDGSWGTARRTKALNINAPVPGAHHSFRVGVTSLCVMALIEADPKDKAARAALERGEAYLLTELPRARRDSTKCLYNTWTHSYGISALVRMLGRHADDGPRCEEIRRQIAQQIDLLKRFESVNGGWGYYDFNLKTQHPGSQPTSFTTATALIALAEARDAGVVPPKQLITRAVNTVKRQQNPNLTYVYSESHRNYRAKGINRAAGSLGRSQSCNLALRHWGDTKITDAVLDEWLVRLVDRNGWLSRARKMPVPHESWFQIAGYFYYYGMFYGGLCIEDLPPANRPRHQQSIAKILLALQEKDGSWWDYPLYDYHQGYGTAMAMMTLVRCLPPPVPEATSGE